MNVLIIEQIKEKSSLKCITLPSIISINKDH